MQQPFGSEKAVEVTSSNQKALMSRYGIDPEDTAVIPIGMWLVADFGDDDTFIILTPEKFTVSYAVGQNLQNGFWDVARK